MTARKLFQVSSNGGGRFSRLKYCLDDAARIGAALGGERYGYEAILTTATDNYTILNELARHTDGCRESDSIVFYFSGHGSILKGELLLVLDGSKPGDRKTFLAVTDLLNHLESCPARQKLVILDCCNAGAAAPGIKTASLPLTTILKSDKANLMLFASPSIESAREFDHLNGSFLTHSLCDFLSNAPAGGVTIEAAVAYMADAARTHNNTYKEEPVPIPYTFGTAQGQFWLAPPPPPTMARYLDPVLRAQPSGNAQSVVFAAVAATISAHRVAGNLRWRDNRVESPDETQSYSVAWKRLEERLRYALATGLALEQRCDDGTVREVSVPFAWRTMSSLAEVHASLSSGSAVLAVADWSTRQSMAEPSHDASTTAAVWLPVVVMSISQTTVEVALPAASTPASPETIQSLLRNNGDWLLQRFLAIVPEKAQSFVPQAAHSESPMLRGPRPEAMPRADEASVAGNLSTEPETPELSWNRLAGPREVRAVVARRPSPKTESALSSVLTMAFDVETFDISRVGDYEFTASFRIDAERSYEWFSSNAIAFKSTLEAAGVDRVEWGYGDTYGHFPVTDPPPPPDPPTWSRLQQWAKSPRARASGRVAIAAAAAIGVAAASLVRGPAQVTLVACAIDLVGCLLFSIVLWFAVGRRAARKLLVIGLTGLLVGVCTLHSVVEYQSIAAVRIELVANPAQIHLYPRGSVTIRSGEWYAEASFNQEGLADLQIPQRLFGTSAVVTLQTAPEYHLEVPDPIVLRDKLSLPVKQVVIFAGRILDPKNAPIEGARVALRAIRPECVDTTDSNGLFALEDCPDPMLPGDPRVDIRLPNGLNCMDPTALATFPNVSRIVVGPNCEQRPVVPEAQIPGCDFECTNHACLARAKVCDGRPDCDDASDEAPGMCNRPLDKPGEAQVAGGDKPEVRFIDVERPGCAVSFSYDTNRVPDRMLVYVGSSVLFDTGCVGRREVRRIPLPLNQKRIIVKVEPNCNGTIGTAWQFAVGCEHL